MLGPLYSWKDPGNEPAAVRAASIDAPESDRPMRAMSLWIVAGTHSAVIIVGMIGASTGPLPNFLWVFRAAAASKLLCLSRLITPPSARYEFRSVWNTVPIP